MNVLIVGSSGMVGQGVLRACLRAEDVQHIVLLVRTPQAVPPDARIRQIVAPDLRHFTAAGQDLAALDACFFCAGVSALGMSEADYRKITLETTLHIARALAVENPELHFVYVSGAGADSSEQGNTMWARVRGETENALFASPLPVTVLRPAFILAEAGIRSKTPLYRLMYGVLRPLMLGLGKILPWQALTTADIGHAMLNTVRQHQGGEILTAKAIAARAQMVPTPE